MNPTQSAEYPYLMSSIFFVGMLGMMASTLPLLELALNIAITLLIVGGVIYLLGKWAWEEYLINKECKLSIEENGTKTNVY